MRNLIRPFLFTVARLALVLAGVLCVVGQFEACLIEATSGYGYLGCATCRLGVLIEIKEGRWSKARTRTKIVIRTASDFARLYDYNELAMELEADFKDSLLPSHQARSVREMDLIIGLPHWLIITTAALFYAFLRFIYRKRPAAALVGTPCED